MKDVRSSETQATPFPVLRWCRSMVRFLSPFGASLAIIAIALLFETSFTAAVPLGIRYLIDRVFLARDQSAIWRLLGVLGAGAVIASGFGLVRDHLMSRVIAGVLRDLSGRMHDRMYDLPLSFFRETGSGDLLTRFSADLQAVESALTSVIPWAVIPALDLFLSLCLLFMLQWQLALFALLIFPIALVGPRVFAARAAHAGEVKRNEDARLTARALEAISAQVVLRAFQQRERMSQRFRQQSRTVQGKAVRLYLLTALVERSASVGVLLLQVAVLALGTYLTLSGSLSPGSLVSFLTLFLTLSYSLTYITQYVPQLVQAGGGLDRIEAILKRPAEVADEAGAREAPLLERTIELRHVRFRYFPERPALEGADLSLERGCFTAVVGGSGSGKSTLLRLLLGLERPSSGEILFDGSSAREYTVASLRRQMAVVFQESLLFDDTIRENIRFGRPEASDEEVEQAARDAEVDRFVAALPDGYETRVGERGELLSGGQRQRVAIARALVRNPEILLLDEATSALDPAAEHAINDTLARVSRGRTTVSVTHRLASVVGADRICVLSAGRVVETGQHGELLARNGVYAELWRKQSGLHVSADGEVVEIDAEWLRQVPLLAEAPIEVLGELADRFSTEHWETEREVIHCGDPGDRFYIVARGRVEVLSAAGGKLAVLSDGDYFGEIALLREVPRTATVRTLQPSLLVSLPREQFLHLVRRSASLQASLEATISARQETST